jgi:hypothetical protein
MPFVRSKFGYLLADFDPFSDYYVIKADLHYRHDPPGQELIHSAGALFHDNYHGIPGAGDCDDFSVLGCAVLIAAQKKVGYALFGNDREPEHISPVFVQGGRWAVWDFVAGAPFEVLPFKWVEFYPL